MDRQAKAVLDEIARAPTPDGTDWAAVHRAEIDSLARFAPAPPVLPSVRDHVLAGGLPARLYRPVADGVLPALLFLHGGGGMAGSLDTHDAPLRELARLSGWAVVAVAYRLAPEHPFPAPVEDCVAALRALRAGAGALGLDPARIAVGGDSIGGLFATVAAREAGAFRQVMLYPNTDLRPEADYPSRREEDGNIISAESLARENATLAPEPGDRGGPRLSPITAELAGLPPALVVTCGCDPLRDEGEAYAARMRAAGVRVTHTRYPGMIHAFLQMGARIDATSALLREVAGFLRASADPDELGDVGALAGGESRLDPA